MARRTNEVTVRARHRAFCCYMEEKLRNVAPEAVNRGWDLNERTQKQQEERGSQMRRRLANRLRRLLLIGVVVYAAHHVLAAGRLDDPMSDAKDAALRCLVAGTSIDLPSRAAADAIHKASADALEWTQQHSSPTDRQIIERYIALREGRVDLQEWQLGPTTSLPLLPDKVRQPLPARNAWQSVIGGR